MDTHKDAAALDGHPKQQRETEPSSKRLDPEAIIILESDIKQLPANPNLVADIQLLMDPDIKIYGGWVGKKVVLSSRPDLSVFQRVEAYRSTVNCDEKYDIAIRRSISAMMRGDYQDELVFQAKRHLHFLTVKINKGILKSDNSPSSRTGVDDLNQRRLVNGFAAVIWNRMISKTLLNYKPLPTDTILVSP